MADRAWKASERRMAKDMGTKRIPCTGERDGADFENARFCFQLKVRSMLPVWLWQWLGGIVGNAAPKGKIGVLVLRQPGQKDDDALVVVQWRDWKTLVTPAARPDGASEPDLMASLSKAS